MNDMKEQSGNSGQLPPDAGSGGDVRARELLAASLASAGRKKGAEAVLAGDLYADTRIALRAIEAALATRHTVGPVAELIEDLAGDVESCVSDACRYLASDDGWREYGVYRTKKRYHALPDRIRALVFPPAAVPVDGPLSGKYGAVLRPFVAMMERELHANAGKGDRPGWLSMDSSTALLEIYHHMGKLQRATKNADEPGIVEYAADVANMAMMLVDVCGLLPVDDATHSQPTTAKDLAALRPRIVAAIERMVSGHGCMRVPAEETDPDLVLADVLSIIDQQAKPEVQ